MVSVSVVPQAAGNLIEHNDCPAQAYQKENFFENDFHAIPLTSCIAREPKELGPNSLIAGGTRNLKVPWKNCRLSRSRLKQRKERLAKTEIAKTILGRQE